MSRPDVCWCATGQAATLRTAAKAAQLLEDEPDARTERGDYRSTSGAGSEAANGKLCHLFSAVARRCEPRQNDRYCVSPSLRSLRLRTVGDLAEPRRHEPVHP